MAEFTENTTTAQGSKTTSITIPSDSKVQYTKGATVRLYQKTFNASPNNYYSIAPNCIIKSRNKKLYTVRAEETKNINNKVVSSTLSIDYLVPKDNVLPKNTGDRAIISFKEAGNAVVKTRISSFYVDTTYSVIEGGPREVIITGDHGATFNIVAKDSGGNVIRELKNLRIPKPTRNESQGRIVTSISIPKTDATTTATVELEVDTYTTVADNIILSHTISSFTPMRVRFRHVDTFLTVTGTNPVDLYPLTAGDSGYGKNIANISWSIVHDTGAKIYLHRQPVWSNEIVYNTDGSSDWTDSVTGTNGGTAVKSTPVVTQVSNTAITVTLTQDVYKVGFA